MPFMKIFGVAAEFNPFHNGHAALLEAARESGCSHCVAVMSGNFVQRCEPAVTDKRVRARAALECGADLILELPVSRATATAARFAQGAVYLMKACGCVDAIAFGSECGDAQKLRGAAQAVDSREIIIPLRKYLGEGMTFAKARQLAVGDVCGGDAARLISTPNNILAVEYLRAAGELSWEVEAFTVKRFGAAHDSQKPDGKYAGASYLRTNINELEAYVPKQAAEIYNAAVKQGIYPHSKDKFEGMMLSYLRRLAPEQLAALPELSEGIEGRLYRAIREGRSIPEIHAALKTKRYTMSRVRRLVLCAFLGITAADVLAPPPYLRVLGMNARGRQILAKIRRNTALPLDTSLARLRSHSPACARAALLEERATDLYTAALPAPFACGYEYTASAVFVGYKDH